MKLVLNNHLVGKGMAFKFSWLNHIKNLLVRCSHMLCFKAQCTQIEASCEIKNKLGMEGCLLVC